MSVGEDEEAIPVYSLRTEIMHEVLRNTPCKVWPTRSPCPSWRAHVPPTERWGG